MKSGRRASDGIPGYGAGRVIVSQLCCYARRNRDPLAGFLRCLLRCGVRAMTGEAAFLGRILGFHIGIFIGVAVGRVTG